jgi:hypothetical protein
VDLKGDWFQKGWPKLHGSKVSIVCMKQRWWSLFQPATWHGHRGQERLTELKIYETPIHALQGHIHSSRENGMYSWVLEAAVSTKAVTWPALLIWTNSMCGGWGRWRIDLICICGKATREKTGQCFQPRTSLAKILSKVLPIFWHHLHRRSQIALTWI